MENYKTIKELADELNISKQALQKRINKLPDNQKPQKVGGKFKIDVELQRYFREIFDKKQPDDNQVVKNDNPLSVVVEDLKKDKKDLINRLEIKEKEMERMQKLLDQQQQLTLQSNKQIDQLQQQVLLLSKPAESDLEEVKEEKEEVDTAKNVEKEEMKMENEKIKSEKKWFHFWK